MNKDSKHSPLSPAEQAARECARKIGLGPDSREAIEAIVSRYLKAEIDRSVAETEEKFRKLARKWRIDEGSSQWSAAQQACASELESLIPKQEGEK